MVDRVITEGRMVWEVPCGHGRFKAHGPLFRIDQQCGGGTSHIVDPRRYRSDPVVKRIIDRANALALEAADD